MVQPVFAAALSTNADSARAEAEVLAAVRRDLGSAHPDLVVVFATHHHGAALEGLGPRLAEALGPRVLVGCTGEAALANGREAERKPGLALWAARLPETLVEPFTLGVVPGPDEAPLFTGLPELGPPGETSALLLADPFAFPAGPFLDQLHRDHPGVPLVGGMASGGRGPGENLLFSADGVVEQGAIGVQFRGPTRLEPLVSQGCRPVGKPWVITACEDNLIQKLGGRPAVDALMETLASLEGGERELLQRAPFIGLAVDAAKSSFGRGDFLVRGLMGIRPQDRAIAVADLVRRGQTIQFLVRDAATAGEDLEAMLERGLADHPEGEPLGALLFTCNGRGTRMFTEADHDAACLARVLGPKAPVAGFFAGGEIGPVGGRNFLHGFTASVALFRTKTADEAER